MEVSLRVYKGRKSIKVDLKETGFFTRGLGLMFRTRFTKNLLFDFASDVSLSITSFFVFFPFLIVWLDSKNRVIEARIINPFVLSYKPDRRYRKFIEIPVNQKNLKLIRFFVGKRAKI